MTFGAPLSATVSAARALSPSPPLEETSKRLLAASTVALQCDAATRPPAQQRSRTACWTYTARKCLHRSKTKAWRQARCSRCVTLMLRLAFHRPVHAGIAAEPKSKKRERGENNVQVADSAGEELKTSFKGVQR